MRAAAAAWPSAGLLAVASAIALALALALAAPAFAVTEIWLTDLDGNELSGEVDVNTLNEGIVVHMRVDNGNRISFTDSSGKKITWAESSSSSDQYYVEGEGWYGFESGTRVVHDVLTLKGLSVQIGETYTFTNINPLAGETASVSITVGKGEGSGEGPGSGDDPGGGSGGDEPADEPGRGDGGEDDGPGDDEPASPAEDDPADEPADEPSNGGKPADEPAGGSTGSGGSDKSGERTGTDDGSDKPGKSGSGSDASPKGDGSEGGGSPSQTSPSSTGDDAGEAAPTAAADDGAEQASGPEDPDELQVYRIGGSIGGSGGGSGSDPAASASQLTVTGVPWMWALLWAVLALAAPLSAAGRLAAPRLGRSRLEE